MKNNSDLPLVVMIVFVIIALIGGGFYVFLLFNPNKNQNIDDSSSVVPTKVLTETEQKALGLLSEDLANGYNPETADSSTDFKLELDKTVSFSKDAEEKKINGKTLPDAEIIVSDDDQEEIETIKANAQGDFEFTVNQTIEGTYLFYFRGFQDGKSSDLKAIEVAIS